MPISEEEMLAAVKAIAESLKSEMTGALAKLDEKCNAMSDAVAKMKADAVLSTSQHMQNDMTRRGTLKSDNDGKDPYNTMAERTAADAVVGRAEMASLSRSIAELQRKTNRPMSDLNAFADAQAKADAVFRIHGERAEPPMAGETLVDYNIRMHRKMQPHSPIWKNVNLNIIAADGIAFGNALEAIRADAVQAGENGSHLKPFDHKEITEVSRGGHRITRFVGNGSIFKQLSRPVRYVSYIGTRNVAQR
jgi:hypothetical protein